MKVRFLFLGLCLSLLAVIPSSAKDGWQQRVEYDIQVRLDDVHHLLRGSEQLTYFNNSPDTLHFIYFHLWPNGYRNNRTPFARQRLVEKKSDFFYAKKEDRGWIDSLHFLQQGGKESEIFFQDKSHEIAKVMLASPLAPGQHVVLNISFRVKIPKIFSRMGHDGQSYQISQWYPKPAVYDLTGWHTFPYLDLGEFYSEYGKFRVSITLPSNYVVASTGRLQTPSEIKFLDSLSGVTENRLKSVSFDSKKANTGEKKKKVDFKPADVVLNSPSGNPASSPTNKTIVYTQDSIHDFAFCADKRFLVKKGGVNLPHSGRHVATYAFFQDNQLSEWKNSTDYIDSTLIFYSQSAGDYPYAAASVVCGALLPTAGGMEYPMMAVIAKVSAGELERVIVHEVGHNWFYGILGSNERDFPWMDEGINSYYENAYFFWKYNHAYVKEVNLKKEFLGAVRNYSLMAGGGQSILDAYEYRIGMDQPPGMHAPQFTPTNYGISVYGKTPALLSYLRLYLGADAFDKAMQHYYEQWKFRHPQPNDVKMAFEEATGKKLGWFFDTLMISRRYMDYKIKDVKNEGQEDVIRIKRKTSVEGPVLIGAAIRTSVMKLNSKMKVDTNIVVHGSQEVKTHFADSLLKSRNSDSIKLAKMVYNPSRKFDIRLPAGGYDYYFINPFPATPDLFGKNNKYLLNPPLGRFKTPKFQLAMRPESFDHYQLFFFPIVGYNRQDGVMAGVSLYSGVLPSPRFEYILAPMYGFGSHNLSGMGYAQYNFFPHSDKFRHLIAPGLSVRQFTFDRGNDLVFRRLVPMLTYEFNNARSANPVEHKLELQSIFIDHFTEKSEAFPKAYDQAQFFSGSYNVQQIRYSFRKHDAVHHTEGTVQLQQSSEFNRVSGELKFRRPYFLPHRLVYLRLFGGAYFGHLPTKKMFFMPLGGTTGKLDPTYENLFLNRQGNAQIAFDAGGLKFASDSFISRHWVTSANFSASVLGKKGIFPLNIYFDAGAYMAENNKVVTGWTGGLSLGPPQGIFVLYFPLAYSGNINSWVKDNRTPYTKQILFTIRFQQLDPTTLKKQVLKLMM